MVVVMIPAIVVIVIAVRAVIMMMVMMPPTVMVMVIIAVICAGSPRMSPVGHQRTWPPRNSTSALPPKADSSRTSSHVRKVPSKPEVARVLQSHLGNTRAVIRGNPPLENATSTSSRAGAVPSREQPTALTHCVMDVAECSTDIDRAQTLCGAATEQHYI
jgi:hypothetical protein